MMNVLISFSVFGRLAAFGVTLPLLMASGLEAWQSAAGPPLRQARGVVFHDVNGDGRLDAGDRRLPGIRVSNGRDVVLTGEGGQYSLSVGEDSIVFVIKPRGWRTRLDRNNLPQFYYIHKPAGSPRLQFPGVSPTGPLPDSIDFPLYLQEEPETFQAILFGDTQSRDETEIGYMNRTTIAELVGSDAAFGVTLGDIVFDDLSQFDYHNRSVALIGIPWYNVLGNHDLNFDVQVREHANETFESLYGPSWYSFDYGRIHFIVLDNINWHIPDGETKPGYSGMFGEDQLEFVRNDLNHIPDDQFVVLFMHIPLFNCSDAESLYRLIEQRPLTFSVSAHQHVHHHHFLGKDQGWQGAEPHHHLVNVTVCGNWWSGRKNADGIPHSTMSDGAPLGYSVLGFDGNRYTLDFRATGMPADYQMRIDLPDQVTRQELADTPVHVNVFNGSPRSTLEMRCGRPGEWVPLKRVEEIDPWYQRVYDNEQAANPPIQPGLSGPKASSHLWRGRLPDLETGVHLIEFRTTDMHDRVWTDQRLLRVTANDGPAAGD